MERIFKKILLKNIDTTVISNSRQYDIEEVRQLARSIKRDGQFTPIIAYVISQRPKRYGLITGVYRVKACKYLKQKTIYAEIVSVDCKPKAIAMDLICPSTPKKKMSDEDITKTIKYLIDDKKMSIKELAVKIGRSESFIRKYYNK